MFGKFFGTRPEFKNVENWPICCTCNETHLIQNTIFTPWDHTSRLVKNYETTVIIATQHGKQNICYFNRICATHQTSLSR